MHKSFLIIALCLTLLPFGQAAAQATVEQILDTGPTDQRINLVFLGDGYRGDELGKFREDAVGLLDYLLATPPYTTYRSYFNAFIIFVASNESGADHPETNTYRDTYFNSSYNCSNIQRLICFTGDGSTKAVGLLQTFVPEYDLPVLIVNDEIYGGAGGFFAITSTNDEARNIVVHETGHAFAGLADTYENGNLPGHEAYNTTAETDRNLIKWRHWFVDNTQIPTPENSNFSQVIGLFEGAVYNRKGWWRPKLTCMMRTLGEPFCEVCQEHHIRALYNRVSPLADYEPTQQEIFVNSGEARVLQVMPMQPSDHALRVEWLIDGTPIAEAKMPTLRVTAAAFGSGTMTFTARVTDDTGIVRDPAVLPLLTDEVTWTITFASSADTEDETPGAGFTLYQNYPNPFNPTTTIRYELQKPAQITLRVFDMLGREMATLVESYRPTGDGQATWDGRDQSGRRVPSGLYFYQLRAEGFQQTRSMMLLR